MATQSPPGWHGYRPWGHSPGRSLPRRSRVVPGDLGLHELAADVGRQHLDLAEVDDVALAGGGAPFEGGDDGERAHRRRPSRR